MSEKAKNMKWMIIGAGALVVGMSVGLIYMAKEDVEQVDMDNMFNQTGFVSENSGKGTGSADDLGGGYLDVKIPSKGSGFNASNVVLEEKSEEVEIENVTGVENVTEIEIPDSKKEQEKVTNEDLVVEKSFMQDMDLSGITKGIVKVHTVTENGVTTSNGIVIGEGLITVDRDVVAKAKGMFVQATDGMLYRIDGVVADNESCGLVIVRADSYTGEEIELGDSTLSDKVGVIGHENGWELSFKDAKFIGGNGDSTLERDLSWLNIGEYLIEVSLEEGMEGAPVINTDGGVMGIVASYNENEAIITELESIKYMIDNVKQYKKEDMPSNGISNISGLEVVSDEELESIMNNYK